MPATAPDLPARCRALEQAYTRIAATRMAGLPVLHPRLRVQAVGFELEAPGGAWASGVLVTPWFMNLLRLPLGAQARGQVLAIGAKAERDCGLQRFEFIGTQEAQADPSGPGAFEAASLFSPMFEFADQAAAVATAFEVLAQLRPPCVVQPARRSFLFGRHALGAAAGPA